MKMSAAEDRLQKNLYIQFGCSDDFISYMTSQPQLFPTIKAEKLREAKRKRKACDRVYPVFLKLMREGKIQTFSELEMQSSALIGWFVWFFIKWIAVEILQYLWERRQLAGY